MPMSYEIDAAQKCVFVKLDGKLEYWSLGRSVQELLDDPRFLRDYCRLVDATELQETFLDETLVRAVAQDMSKDVTGRVALVGASSATRAWLELYKAHLDNVESVLFDSRAAALRWLEVSDPEANRTLRAQV